MLEVMGREIAFAPSARASVVSGLYQVEGVALHIEWCRRSFEQLYWSQGSALLFLQGAPLQQLVNPWVLLKAESRPVHDPLPGADNVVLAELLEAPPALTLEQLFALLLPEAGVDSF